MSKSSLDLSTEQKPLNNSKSSIDLSMELKGGGQDGGEMISVKERTQKFNRMASVEDELSPRQYQKEKEKEKKNRAVDKVSILYLDTA